MPPREETASQEESSSLKIPVSPSAPTSVVALALTPAQIAETGSVSHPDDPLNWPVSRKWIVTAALSISGFNRIVVSTIMAPALPVISRELNLTTIQSTAALGAFVLATAFSPLILGPLSEVYGRAPVLHITNIWFFAFNLACGFVDTGAGLIASRLLAGFGAGAIFALASGVLGDLWSPEQRGATLSIYLLVPLLGAGVGPIIGGFVEQYTTWRWMFWSTSIMQAFTVTVCLIWFRETHLPTLKTRRSNINNETPSSSWRKPFSQLPPIPGQLLRKSFSTPPKQLLLHRSVQLQAALSGFGYGILYLVLSTFSSLFTSNYNESVSVSGLHYIALCLGEIVGSQIGGRLMDYLARKAKKITKSDRFQPEFHLPIIVPGAVMAAAGFLMYGWAAQRRVPWIVVDIGVFILSLGLQMTGQGLQAYNMDTYPDSRASTSAAIQVFRSLGAFALPLAGPKMYSSMGYGWANTMLGSIYVGGHVSGAAFLWKRGAALRAASDPVPLEMM
ncbi:major facilitator superfamily domain-containing protein [Naematelia encephala]|uniref:Major facilitator superfamily domain-containing protein n=1 Tax=Naematelia encephala TaxID=71784 RepID=A0A1Y2AWZ6_9TREE|nr:major facilitator superfamily domain-containing protein [Naematelia encephala]